MIISKEKYENLLEKVNRNSRQIMQLNCSHDMIYRELKPFSGGFYFDAYEETCSNCGKDFGLIGFEGVETRMKEIYKAKSEHYKKLSGEIDEHNT